MASLPMRANEPYVDDAILPAILNTTRPFLRMLADRTSRLTSAGVAQSAAFDLPVPRRHGIARFGIGRAAVEEAPKLSERDDPHIAAIAWSLGPRSLRRT
jgi:hypothetical protein